MYHYLNLIYIAESNDETGKKITISILVLIAITTAIYFLFFNKTEQISYLTEKAVIGNIKRTVNTTGEIGAKQIVTIGAQVSGQIQKLYVSLGQQIKKGDMIAEIDSTTQVNELNINKAKLESYIAIPKNNHPLFIPYIQKLRSFVQDLTNDESAKIF